MEPNAYRSDARSSGLRRVAAAAVVVACLAGVNAVASRFARSSASASAGAPLASDAGDTTNCAACHEMTDGFTHPVGVAPSMHVPDALPLADGLMSCETCHDGPSARGHAAFPATGKDYLRIPEELGSLCATCHRDTHGRGAHGSGSIRAHLAKSDVRLARPGIDDESRACITCHDGVTASDAGAHPVLREPGEDSAATGSDHPIGIVYDESRIAAEGSRMKPVLSVDRRVRLFGRTAGCGSCHSVYAKRESLLVMSNRGSALCTSCHAL